MSTSAHSPAESATSTAAAVREGGQVTDRLLALNSEYAKDFRDPGMDARPVLQVAVVACMDARLDLHAALGLELGDCHTIRNAGGVVTEDVIR
ncbi:carbonic anhydrase, partial [Streptomyces sp. SID7982]|nr:carbonic anhydrase [Streptomyces sp. SID7982]